jgi:aminoglycoside 3-N-acetyltransferase
VVALKDLRNAFETLHLTHTPVIVHASLKSFGFVDGGVHKLVDALLSSFGGVIMPTFTYKTMITPLTGPKRNGITYGAHQDLNRMAEYWRSDLPADKTIGIVAETLRRYAAARRSNHPILSFAGINADDILAAQAHADPLAPIGALAKRGGWAVLMGVDHTVNTSIHYAEKLAGRLPFIRWALTPGGIIECPGFPGDSSGFNMIEPHIAAHTHKIKVGEAIVRAMPLEPLFKVVKYLLRDDEFALLCNNLECERCGAYKHRPRN